MFDIPISKMNDKQLRNAVQMLYDELAIFKRKYEDAIYNLDSDNLGKSFTVEQNNMKAQIKVTADAIKTMVSDTDLQSALESYSTIEQTATAITSTVSKEYVDSLIGDTYVTNAVLSTQITQSADEIYLSVSQEYETKSDAEASYSAIENSITLTAQGISLRVESLEDFKTSVFTQTEYGFTLDGDTTTFTGVVFLTDNAGNKRFEISHDESQGYEQVFISSYGNEGNNGLPIKIGRTGDTLNFSGCSSIVWGSNAPVAVFG